MRKKVTKSRVNTFPKTPKGNTIIISRAFKTLLYKDYMSKSSKINVKKEQPYLKILIVLFTASGLHLCIPHQPSLDCGVAVAALGCTVVTTGMG